MDYINSTSSTSSIYGTLPRTKKREKSKREKRTPEDMAAHIANYVVYKAEPVSNQNTRTPIIPSTGIIGVSIIGLNFNGHKAIREYGP